MSLVSKSNDACVFTMINAASRPNSKKTNRQVLDCDTILIAAGQAPDLSFLEEGGADVEQFRPGWPKVDPVTLMTTAQGVFVAGDLAAWNETLDRCRGLGKKSGALRLRVRDRANASS